MEMIAQRKQRVYEEFGVPPGVQQQLNPFEGKASQQDGGGLGGEGGQGQRVVGDLTPAAKALNITIQNERKMIMNYANECLDLWTATARVHCAERSKQITPKHKKAHNPDNWKMKYIISGVQHISVYNDLYKNGIIKYDAFVRAYHRTYDIEYYEFEEETQLTLKEQNGVEPQPPEEDDDEGEGGAAKKKKKKKAKK
jgi:hypothetical protein